MKVFFSSDIHVDTHHVSFTLRDIGVDVDSYDVIVLAGDLTNGYPQQLDKIIKDIPVHKPIIVVLGNHDYWNNEFSDAPAKFIRHFKREGYSNVHLLDYKENPYVCIEDVVFIGSTLWTDAGENSAVSAMVESCMPDCSRILGARGLLRQKEVYYAHLDTLEVFEDTHNLFYSKKKVLITHHCVTDKSLSPLYANTKNIATNALNRGYYSDLEYWLVEQDFLAVISGHTHFSTDFTIGNTKMLSNPFGYPNDECAVFNPNACLEI